MMLEYDDEIMQDEDWLYEEDKPKKVNRGFNNKEKITPPAWTQRGCEVVNDPEAKERMRKDLEKKEKEKQNNQSRSEKMKAYWAERRANGETAKKKADKPKKESPKMTFADVAAELKQMEAPAEESNVDESLDRLAKLREMTEPTVQESVKTEELTENIIEEPAPDQEVVVEEGATTIATTIPNNITLVLTASEAESLYMFIKDELLTVVKRDDIEEMDWLVDMCSIYNGLRKVLIK